MLDVAIIGGGPAGAAAALSLRQLMSDARHVVEIFLTCLYRDQAWDSVSEFGVSFGISPRVHRKPTSAILTLGRT